MNNNDSNGTTLGIPTLEYNAKATRYAKNTIGWWIITGLAYNLFAGKFTSLSTLLLFLPGSLLIIFVAIPLFIVTLKKEGAVQSLDNRDKQSLELTGKHLNASVQLPVLIMSTIWALIDFAFPMVSAILAMYYLNR